MALITRGLGSNVLLLGGLGSLEVVSGSCSIISTSFISSHGNVLVHPPTGVMLIPSGGGMVITQVLPRRKKQVVVEKKVLVKSGSVHFLTLSRVVAKSNILTLGRTTLSSQTDIDVYNKVILSAYAQILNDIFLKSTGNKIQKALVSVISYSEISSRGNLDYENEDLELLGILEKDLVLV